MKLTSTFLALTISFAIIVSPIISLAEEDNAQLEAAFTELCNQSANAEQFSIEKLTEMVAECDSLKEKIANSSHPKKKVLLFRLKKCRNFLAFIIETKQQE